MASAILSVAKRPSASGGPSGETARRRDRDGEREGAARQVRLLLVTVGLGIGGTEGQLLELASRLDRVRFAVTVCAFKGRDVIARELEARGIRVVTLEGRGVWDPRVVVKLWRLVRAERPHIIHGFLFWANVASRVVGRVTATPLVLSSYRGLPLWVRWYERHLDRLTARWAHAVTCCSDAVRQQAQQHLGGDPERYVTIHNGVDLPQFNGRRRASRADLGLPRKGVVIGTVGRLVEPEKGLPVLLEALARIANRPRAPSWHLVIVGEGPEQERLQAMATRLGIEGHVSFAGARRDVARALGVMNLFVMPSRFEGFGIAAVEAMAAGRPVVATRVGGLVEIVHDGQTGVLVEPGDAEALAAAVQGLLQNPERARRMGAKGRKRAEQHFSIEGCVRRHAALYTELLAAQRAAGAVETSCSSSR